MSRAGLVLAAALAAALPLRAAQNAPPAGREQALHLEALRTERTALFFAAWEAAQPEARAAAETLLAADGGAPLGARPALEDLARARRVLLGADPAREDPLAALADSLDLQVVPGAFPARREGRGEPLVVTVYRAWRRLPASDVEVRLEWVGPAGEREVARTEPFAAEAFDGRGFPMYVRAPLSEPGAWRLVPVLRQGEREAEGAPVAVDCVADLEARVAAVLASGDEAPATDRPGGGAAAARLRLAALLEKGLRGAEAGGAKRLLAMLEGTSWSAWIPLEGGSETDPAAPRLFGGFPGDRREGALVVLWSGGASEDLPVLGPAGEAWIALARERGLGWFVLRAEAGEPEVLRAGLAEVRRRAGRPPILVARGASTFAATLLLLSAGREQPIELERLVLSSPSGAPPRILPSCPVLCVVPAGAAGAPETAAAPPGDAAGDEGGADAGGHEAVRLVVGARDAFLAEPRLPERVAEWLDAAAAPPRPR